MSDETDWEAKALEYAGKLKELVKVIKEEREANRKVRCAVRCVLGSQFSICARVCRRLKRSKKRKESSNRPPLWPRIVS